jgi:hypothetical protein
MTDLPQKDSPPLAYALQWLEHRKDMVMVGVPALQPGAGQDFLREHLQLTAMSDVFGMMWVIENARAGWDEARIALRELQIKFMHSNKEPPALLKAYIMEILKEPSGRSRGRRKSKNVLQDICFVALVADLVKQFALDPTRKTNSQHCNSACDYVAVAINRTRWLGRSVNYKAVEAVWLRWSVRL